MTGGTYNNFNTKSINVNDLNHVKNNKSQLFFTSNEVEPLFPGEHEPFNVYFNFKSIGSVDVGEFKIRMITECKENSSLGVDIEDQIVPSLNGGATGEVILRFDYGMPTGTYVINAYLDYNNQIRGEGEYIGNRSASCVVIVG
ncbi:MAG: hypothetical protein A4E25_02430 [Methanobacterium sp. PtaB.Bin024]|jgi:hypothetical protein|nr:MAG: hypothetical protein A4E25_02430 [Methanobacterium sp. PtaB.Bin024]